MELTAVGDRQSEEQSRDDGMAGGRQKQDTENKCH